MSGGTVLVEIEAQDVVNFAQTLGVARVRIYAARCGVTTNAGRNIHEHVIAVAVTQSKVNTVAGKTATPASSITASCVSVSSAVAPRGWRRSQHVVDAYIEIIVAVGV